MCMPNFVSSSCIWCREFDFFTFKNVHVPRCTVCLLVASMLDDCVDLLNQCGHKQTNKQTNKQTERMLYCLDIQHEDSGNYTCEVNGPHNVLLGSVTHFIYVRGTLLLAVPLGGRITDRRRPSVRPPAWPSLSRCHQSGPGREGRINFQCSADVPRRTCKR